MFSGVYLGAAAKEAGAPGGQLDECTVTVYPPLNPDHETLRLPDDLVAELGLAATVTRQGAAISGANSPAHYQSVLRQIHYSNRKPAYYLNRAFKLACSELGGRFTSNEYTQTVTVIHPQISVSENANKDHEATLVEEAVHHPPKVAHLQVNQHHAHIKDARISDRSLDGAMASSASTYLLRIYSFT